MSTAQRQSWRGRALALGVAVLLAGCVPTSRIKPVESLAEVQPGQMLVVGRIELDPPLKPGEQQIGKTYAEFDRATVVIVDSEPRVVDPMGSRPSIDDMKQRLIAPFGQNFFVSHVAQPFYILKSWVVLYAKVEVSAKNSAADDWFAPLHGMFRVDARPGDKAVYIGTIRYHRDEFFSTTKVVVRDDYASANAEFQRRFGRGVSLRKALAVPVARP